MKAALAVLLLVASSVALPMLITSPAAAAPVQVTASRVAASRAPSSGLPRRVSELREVHGGTVETSSNWSGYAVIGGGFSSVNATWVQPAIQPSYTSTQYRACFWAGLDGRGSSTVEQTGTVAYT